MELSWWKSVWRMLLIIGTRHGVALRDWADRNIESRTAAVDGAASLRILFTLCTLTNKRRRRLSSVRPRNNENDPFLWFCRFYFSNNSFFFEILLFFFEIVISNCNQIYSTFLLKRILIFYWSIWSHLMDIIILKYFIERNIFGCGPVPPFQFYWFYLFFFGTKATSTSNIILISP